MHYKQIPNMLTLLRIFMAPVIVLILLVANNHTVRLICAILFALTALTDFFDGYLARKFNARNEFGRCFDPIADKILVILVLFTLTYRHMTFFAPAAVILFREVIIAGIREKLSEKNIIVHVTYLAKIKTVLQFISIIGIILFEKGRFLWIISNILLIISALLSIATMINYIKAHYTCFRKELS
jgi:CDP-diacylglycerol---glycerol-3-phosphate 3-phosphatidyltransferase